jgi:tagatose 6-phosphate kinase
MSDGVIVTVTLNAALHVAYTAGHLSADGVNPVSRPVYRADGRGVTAARVLHAFGHDVLAAGLAGGTAGELIRSDLAGSGVPTAFTQIRGESRRVFSFVHPDGRAMKFGEPGPYITTEELGRFAADYRGFLSQAAAVVLSGSLPDGLPTEMYGTLVTYAVEAGVPVVLDAGGEELLHAAAHRPDLVVADGRRVRGDADLGSVLVRLGATAAAIAGDQMIRVVTGAGEWIANVAAPNGDVTSLPARGALVAGMIPGQLLGWSWPDRLKHALALAAGGAAEVKGSKDVDLAAYERLLDTVSVKHIVASQPHSRSAS